MIYRLDFNSLQYFNRPTTSRNLITYAVDWSFLPENKKYKMRFSFIAYKRPTGTYDGTQANRVEVDFGTLFNQNLTGSNQINRKNNIVLGIWKSRKATDTAGDRYLCILPHHNPPVFLHNRPSNNFITVLHRANTNALTGVLGNTDYLMSLYFEEIGDKIIRPIRNTRFRVDLNSKVFFSSKNPNTTTNRKYAIDWSFLDEYKKYKMTFDFLSQRRIEGTNALYDNWINQASYTPINCTIDVREENNLTITQLSNNAVVSLLNRTAFDTNINKFIHIKYKVLAGAPDFFQLFFGTTGTMTGSVVYFYDKDNLTYRAGNNTIINLPQKFNVNDENIIIDKWKYITFDMSEYTGWTGGNLTQYRLDPVQTLGGVQIPAQIQYEYFIISDSPNVPGTVDFDSNSINTVSLNLGNNKNYSGSSAIGRKQTKTAGIINISNSTGTETQQYAKPTHNPPTFLDDRPRDNFIEVDLLNFENTSDQTHADYLMNLFFEEC